MVVNYVQVLMVALLFGVASAGLTGLRAPEAAAATTEVGQLRARRLPGNTDSVNDALAGLEFDLELGELDELQVDPNIFATVGTTAAVSDLSLGDIAVTGTRLNQQDYELKIEIIDFEFTGVVDVSFRCTGFFAFFCPSPGIVTLSSSAPNNAVTISITKILRSPDLDTILPTEVIDDAVCTDIVDLDSVEIVVSEVFVLFINVGGLATDLVNEPESREQALGPLRDTLCDALFNISASLDDLLINNPISDIVPDPILSFDTLVANAQASVIPGPGEDVLDLGEFSLGDLIDDIFGGNSTLVDDIFDVVDPLIGVNSTLELIEDFLNGLNISAILRQGLQIMDEISLPLDLGELGSVVLNASNIQVALDLPDTIINGDLTTSQQIIELPEITLGDLSASVDLEFDIQLSATDILLPGLAIDISIFDAFTAELSLTGIAAKLAILFALDLNSLPGVIDFQIGALYEALIQCIISLFVVPPALIADFALTALGVSFTGVDDVIIFAIVDFIQALLEVYGWALPVALGSLVTGLSDTLFGGLPDGCPEIVPGADAALAYDFTQDPVLTTVNSVLSLVDSELTGDLTGGLGDLGDIDIITSEITVGSILIPSTGNSLELKINSLSIGELFPLTVDELELLNPDPTSPFAPQGLQTGIAIGSSAVVQGVAQLNIISSTGTVIDANQFDASLGLSSESAFAEIFASLSNFEVLGRKLRDLIDIPCIIADLDQYGGLKSLAINLEGLTLGFTCQSCDTPALVELSTNGLDELKTAILEDIGNITSAAVDLFSTDDFDDTIAAAAATCAGEGTLTDIFGSVIDVATNTLDEYLAILESL